VTVDFARPPVLVLMGVTGSGKSTVGGLLAGRLGWDFGEGDDLHPRENVDKMASGRPLTDEDRRPWLRRIRAWIDGHIANGEPGIITCSALKRGYRDILRNEHVVFVHLAGSRDQLGSRMTARQGHFMPASLLDSQLADLEPPDPDEQAIEIGIGARPAGQADAIVAALGLD
jgi:gluconokinase